MKLNKLIQMFRASRKSSASRFAGRAKTRDISFKYRMGTGFAGDVNRTHPASIEPVYINTTTPPLHYGQPVLLDASGVGVRPYAAGDQSDSTASVPWGAFVRPYPTQASTADANGGATIGGETPPASGVGDALRSGYIFGKLNTGTAKKGLPVYVWAGATSGAHVQGQYEVAATSGQTTLLTGWTFNGPADADGIVELCVNV